MADKGGYNPYENRNVVSPISNFGAFVSLLKSIIGTGIMALPQAFYFAGIINGIVLLILVTFMLIHGIKLLTYSMVECSRRMQVGYANYPESIAYSFRQGPDCFKNCAKGVGYFVDGVLALFHYGICELYIAFVATNLKQIVDYRYQQLDLSIYVLLTGLCTIPLFLIRSLKWLVPFNLLACVLVYCGFLVMFFYLLTGLPSLSERYIVFGDVQYMGLFFGIVLFSVSSVGVMMAIESKMKTPQDYLGWCGMLNLTTYVVLVSNIIFGFFGYWRYGDQVADCISYNLPGNEPVAQFSNCLIVIAIFLSYPLSGYVVIDIVMNHYWNRNGKLDRPKLKENSVRVVFVILTTITGMMAIDMNPLLSLFGAFSVSLLNLVFPALMEICLYYPPEYSYGRCKWRLVKDIALVIIGFIILIEGTVYSIVTMVEQYGGVDSQDTEGPKNNTIAGNTTIEATAATTALAEVAADSALRFVRMDPSFNP